MPSSRERYLLHTFFAMQKNDMMNDTPMDDMMSKSMDSKMDKMDMNSKMMMSKNHTSIILAVVVGVVVLGTFLYTVMADSSEQAAMTGPEDAMMMDGDGVAMEQDAAVAAQSYDTYSAAKLQGALDEKKQVIVYFHADWCPKCRVIEKKILADTSVIPANTVILKADYDSERALRDRYDVRVQTTFVILDASGNRVDSIWNPRTVAEIFASQQQAAEIQIESAPVVIAPAPTPSVAVLSNTTASAAQDDQNAAPRLATVAPQVGSTTVIRNNSSAQVSDPEPTVKEQAQGEVTTIRVPDPTPVVVKPEPVADPIPTSAQNAVVVVSPTPESVVVVPEPTPTPVATASFSQPYEAYSAEKVTTALSSGKRVALYFHADWCPKCRVLENKIKGDYSQIPSDAVIARVEYDNEIALRDQYSVYTQTTLVVLNPDGSVAKKIFNPPTVAEIFR